MPSTPGNPVLHPPLPAPEFIPGLTAPLPSHPEAQSSSPIAVDGSRLALQTRVPLCTCQGRPPGLRALHMAAPHWPLRPRLVAGYLGATPAPLTLLLHQSTGGRLSSSPHPPRLNCAHPTAHPRGASHMGRAWDHSCTSCKQANQLRRSVQRAERTARHPLYHVKPRHPGPQTTNKQAVKVPALNISWPRRGSQF